MGGIKTHYIADALSRAPVFAPEEEEFTIDCAITHCRQIKERFRFRFRFRFLFRIYRLVQITIFLLFIMPSYIPVAMEASGLRALLHCQCLFAVYVTLLICLTYGFLYFFGGIRLFTFFRLHRSHVLNYAVMLMGIYLGCD